jgi:hypothetical protein
MCSLSFQPTSGGFLLAMNRDEQRDRPLARPPCEHLVAGWRALYPSEPDGGTWIGGNERGIILALLNWYARPACPESGTAGRGTLIPALLEATSAQEISTRLTSLPLELIKPFRLVAFSGSECSIIESRWDGHQLESVPHPWKTGHWFSSGFDEPRATSIRAATCERHAAPFSSTDDLLALHRSHHPKEGPFSLCMHRDDAQTVSCTLLEWTPSRLAMDYIDGPPCTAATRHQTTLA